MSKTDEKRDEFYAETFKKLTDAWGMESEMRMAIEEMSELTKELCKFIRYSKNDQTPENDSKLEQIKNNIIEETADVQNCIMQLKNMFGAEKVEKIQDHKIKKTRQKVDKWLKEHKK